MGVPSVYQDVWKKTAKNLCLEIALSHFQWFKEDRNEFLESTVTGAAHEMKKSWNGVGTLHFPDIWGLILWYENATPQNIHQIHELLQSFHWELLVSSTLYTVLDLLDQTVICLGYEVVLGWSPIPQLWGSGNGCLWITASKTAWLLWQQNFKLIPRWDKCINVRRDY